MRPSLLSLALGAISMSMVRADFTLNTTALQELPKCVTNCGIEVLPTFNCSLGEPCYCARTGDVADAVTACVMAACPSMVDALEGLHFQADGCGWPRDRNETPTGLAVTIALFVLTTVFLLARLASRWPRWSGAGFSWDDCAATMCYVPILGMAVVGYHMCKYGLGKDMWMVPIPDVLKWSKWFFAVQPLYIFAAYCTKLSLVLLYLRTWPQDGNSNRTFRLLCKAVGVLLCVTSLASVLSIIFGCHPISNAWRYANRANGTCIDRVAAAYAFGGINTVFDLIVIMLPIPRLLKLRVSTQQKIGIISCFLVGFVVTACSIVRLTHLNGLTSARNATWDFYPLCLWSIVEVYCSMMCCCMPALAGLLKRCFNRVGNKSSIGSPRAARIPSFDMVHPEKSYKETQYSEEYVGLAIIPPIHPRGSPRDESP